MGITEIGPTAHQLYELASSGDSVEVIAIADLGKPEMFPLSTDSGLFIPQSVGRFDEGRRHSRIEGRMGAIGHNCKPGVRQRLVEVPGGNGRAYDVVATLDDVAGDIGDRVRIIQDVVVFRHKEVVDRVV